jgi:hypothetical protein
MASVLPAVVAAAKPLMPTLYLSHGGGPCFFFDKREAPMFDGMDKVGVSCRNVLWFVSNAAWVVRTELGKREILAQREQGHPKAPRDFDHFWALGGQRADSDDVTSSSHVF